MSEAGGGRTHDPRIKSPSRAFPKRSRTRMLSELRITHPAHLFRLVAPFRAHGHISGTQN